MENLLSVSISESKLSREQELALIAATLMESNLAVTISESFLYKHHPKKSEIRKIHVTSQVLAGSVSLMKVSPATGVFMLQD